MKSTSPTKVRTKHEIALLHTAGTPAEPVRSEFESPLERNAALLKRTTNLYNTSAAELGDGLRILQHPPPVVWRRIQERLFPPNIPEEKLAALGVTNADFLALVDADSFLLWANPRFSEWSGCKGGTLAASCLDPDDRPRAEIQAIMRLVRALKEGDATEANAIFHSNELRTGSVLIRVVPLPHDSAESLTFLVIARMIALRTSD